MKALIYALLVSGMLSGGLSAIASPPLFTRILLDDAPVGAQPSVALDDGRGFIVTWQHSDGVRSTLRWMTVDFDGRRTGEGEIGSGLHWFVNWADTPALTVLDNGDWVAFWLQHADPSRPEGYDIRLVRSTDRGRSWSAPVSPHRDGTITQHGFVSLLPDGADRVLLVWLDGRLGEAAHDHESAPMTLRSAIVNGAGQVLEETLLDELTCSCCQTDIARWGDGPVVVYRDRTAEEIRDISLVRRASSTWSAPIEVHTDGWRIEGCPVNGPAIAVNNDRGLIFWPTIPDDSMLLRYVSLPNADNFATSKAANEVSLPAPASGRVDAAAWRDGFLLTWISRARERPVIEYAFVDSAGRLELGHSIAQPSVSGRTAGFPRMASTGDVALVVWPESKENEPVIGIALLR